MSDSKYSKNRQKLIDDMLDDYGYLFCQKKGCGTSNAYKFECHHIIFRSEMPNHPQIHNIRNLIIVCSGCHNVKPNSFHNKKDERNYLIKERNLKELFNINT